MIQKRILIAEDEKPALKLISEYLKAYPSLDIIATCEDGNETISSINKLKPDVVFLDIQMPLKSGFEVIQEIEHIPQIIFTTAYDDFAIQAFEVNAVDYILKPYTRERLNQAVQKINLHDAGMTKALQLLSDSLTITQYPKRILVEQGQKLVNILTESIICIEASGDYSIIRTADQTFLSNRGISELDKKLDPQFFRRIHRSSIVSMSSVREARRDLSGLTLILVNGMEMRVSRSYSEEIRKLIF
ncbi:two-component system, LytT family, response regulator [Pedobacter terrae]|uniref:Two-component system, LytT family, response regulator n=1 Tax=Pedobacter terrae TaxID=405671 RepID=A0A1G8EF00_9SPHI|nr:LytTR family DNA-binding domain-containing protein [Pedobacter terrae]SDH68465.1 two-component system, LytT family, response regulator [Pedobacter terrae]